jgi:hypothetical protein
MKPRSQQPTAKITDRAYRTGDAPEIRSIRFVQQVDRKMKINGRKSHTIIFPICPASWIAATV